jgi:N-dimethylarginine dimethylaminohydrolase
MSLSYQSETGKIKQILLKSPLAAFQTQDKIDQEWKKLNYLSKPDLNQALIEFDQFKETFENADIQVIELDSKDDLTLDSIYCRDASILTDRGAILCRMGKPARRGEQVALEGKYKSLNIPILGRIDGDGIIEGGDTFWLDKNTLAIGRGYRTNAEAISQVRNLGQGHFDVLEIHLPHYKGSEDVFHLMSIISPIDKDLLLVYSPLMPVPFRELLIDKKFELVEVPEEEFESMGINVLAIGPRECLMLEGNPVTKLRLEKAGCKVHTYQGTQISAKGCGGPTCLTRPLARTVS